MIYVIIFFAVLLIAYAIFSLIIALKIIKPQNKNQKSSAYQQPSELGLMYEEVVLPIQGGLKLNAWYFPANSHDTLLLLHGIHLSKPYLIPFAKAFQEMGINVLLPDHRAHGESDGKWITYGKNEVQDIIETVNWLEKNKPFQKLSMFGISYGSIIGSQAGLKIKEKFHAFVFQSPYTNLDLIIRWTITRKLGNWAKIMIPGVRLWVKLLAGFWLNQVDVLGACSQLDKPTLFIAAEKDEVCPVYETVKCHEASAKPSEIWIVKDAKHNNIHKVAGEEFYFKKIYQFITQNT
ncbi:MAG: alpha/beta hydrolase [Bacteroidia bacterium]|nr:MAG: alpha/beta hydrolase [Bacteroidia bacterium]